jgi:hypothetical protein
MEVVCSQANECLRPETPFLAFSVMEADVTGAIQAQQLGMSCLRVAREPERKVHCNRATLQVTVG